MKRVYLIILAAIGLSIFLTLWSKPKGNLSQSAPSTSLHIQSPPNETDVETELNDIENSLNKLPDSFNSSQLNDLR